MIRYSVEKRLNLEEDLEEILQQLLSPSTGKEILDEVRRSAPRRTGRTAESFGAVIRPGEEIVLFSTSFIARLYNYGFITHVWAEKLPSGRLVFHRTPGVPKNPDGHYVEPAVERALQRRVR